MQVRCLQFEDRIGRSCGRPDGGILKKILVDVRFHRLGVTDGRHAADREAGDGAHELRLGATDGFACILADALLVDAVRAARQNQDWLARLLPPEDQRLDDLTELTPGAVRVDSVCSITV